MGAELQFGIRAVPYSDTSRLPNSAWIGRIERPPPKPVSTHGPCGNYAESAIPWSGRRRAFGGVWQHTLGNNPVEPVREAVRLPARCGVRLDCECTTGLGKH